ncbi:MAG: hypothetical protein COV09_00050 [Candidatus Vogelbacteria bacterium CG10_big_fil_rev_8_21_14_0_10_50_13]|uniref:Uncharacterized protein n=1 Tax=Candidatus Vogelbacteria bacterium CG10_big_fil_rev_8_21_14_0_10_50_13 TaxID=1975044 RepID=A0A2H0RI37_9BACT|nr:MAG: hypothetical protein COV09_00050 [Candidatus Vogelbacteria bacterium CG10_big_fil_rev_8_21_14_0_10_50_13]
MPSKALKKKSSKMSKEGNARNKTKATKKTTAKPAKLEMKKNPNIPGYLVFVQDKTVSLPSVTTRESISMLTEGKMPKKSKTGESFKGKNKVIIS